jgi:hypothetical protein
MAEIQIEDYVAPVPEEKDSPLKELAQQLDALGPEKMATVVVDDEAAATRFIREIRLGARQIGKSARQRDYTVIEKGPDKGKIRLSVSVVAKITKTKRDESDASTTE